MTLFTLVVIYIFSFLIWWTYLLYTQVEQHFTDTIAYEKLIYEKNKKSNNYYQSTSFLSHKDKFKRQKIMVITESAVFIFILILVVLYLRRAILTEFKIYRQQKNFMLSITHELKSPLSSIKLITDSLLKRKLNEEQKTYLLNSSLSEIERLNKLIDNILTSARLDSKLYLVNKERLNLSKLINELILLYKESKEKEIETTIPPNIYFNIEKESILSILSNLIDNALKYAPNESIRLSLSEDKNGIIISVCDQGPGISNKEKPLIFNKFYRVGNEETRTAKGTGIGLFIVKELVLLNNGSIEVLDNTPKGCCFKIKLNFTKQ